MVSGRSGVRPRSVKMPVPVLLLWLLVLQAPVRATAQLSPPDRAALTLSTSERQRLCEQEPTRSRRSSEWSRQQQGAAGSGSGSGSGSELTAGAGGCPRTWDGALCWPATGAGTNLSLPCFHEFRGLLYDTSGETDTQLHTHSDGPAAADGRSVLTGAEMYGRIALSAAADLCVALQDMHGALARYKTTASEVTDGADQTSVTQPLRAV